MNLCLPQVDAPANGSTGATGGTGGTPEANGNQQHLTPKEKRLVEVMSGRTPIQLYLEFLFSHNHAGEQWHTMIVCVMIPVVWKVLHGALEEC